MFNKNIKVTIIVVSIAFMFSILVGIYINNRYTEITNLEFDSKNSQLLQKDLRFELYYTYYVNNMSYDKLNSIATKLINNIDILVKKYPKYVKFTEIQTLILKQKKDIELIKKSNDKFTSSFDLLKKLIIKELGSKQLDDKSKLDLKLISRKLIGIFHDIKHLDYLKYNKYNKYIEKLENIKLSDPVFLDFQKRFIVHSSIVIKNARLLKKSLLSFESQSHKIDKKYKEINNLAEKEKEKEKNILFFIQFIIIGLFSILLFLLFYSLKMEKIYKVKEKKLKNLIKKHIIISSTDTHGIITEVNEAFCKISGYTEKELIGQPHNIVRHPDVSKEFFEDMWNTIKSKKTWQGKIKDLKKDGTFFWVDTVIEPILDENNDIKSFISIKMDITDAVNLKDLTKNQEKIIEEKTLSANRRKDRAIEAVKAKDQFLANMSHEIRTPLNSIIGFLDLLMGKERDKEKSRYLLVMKNSSYSLLEIINDILDFSKIESGKLDIDKTDFKPSKEFEFIQDAFQARLEEKNLKLLVTYDKLPAFLHGDILRIKQVINNLLSNAIKFTPNDKNIYMKIKYKTNLLHVSIKDEGIGISKEYQKNIFDPFTQEDSSTTRKYGGTGLGLSISYKLVEAMGGELKLKSKVGVGSEFYFQIPLKLGKDIENKTIEDRTEKQTGHILLAEDNKSNQMLMKIILKNLGFTCDIANDGLEAVELFKQNRYDAILMDENMPHMSGIEATKEIIAIEKKTNAKHTPIIALTANAIKGDRERFLEAGMDEYLTKPLDKNKLVKILSRLNDLSLKKDSIL